MRSAGLAYADQTLREIVHVSAGGSSIRVRLSNRFGAETLRLGSVHLALDAGGSRIVPGSDRALSFQGRRQVELPAGADLVSDPVALEVAPQSDLAISLYVPGPAFGAAVHYAALQTSYVGSGDRTAAASIGGGRTQTAWVFLEGVDVLAGPSASTLAALGDSITDGAHSTPSADHRWPDFLAARLLGRPAAAAIGVVNAGIGGNRLLHDPLPANAGWGISALARLDDDVLSLPSVRYLIVMEGINDLGHPGSAAPLSQAVTAEDLIAGLAQVAERAHENGIRAFCGTLAPFEGTTIPGYFNPAREAVRQRVNAWIRSGAAFDGVIDFDRALRDPAHPDRIRPAFDSGDHLHPSDAGYRAMAEAVDLGLFR